ncbi:MmcQ/YjbR family DNA-binding protein [Bacteroides thetaiotaomicron]|nr:MmcQ/YjbR family DNA-binding protein [Bacteroides thetaiotaomicron]
MNVEEFREFCLSLSDSSEKMPFQAFRAAQSILAFYVGGRIFCFFDIDKFDACTVKCNPDIIDELKARYMAVSTPYNMSRKYWISIRFNDDMPDNEIKQYVLNSYMLLKERAKKHN